MKELRALLIATLLARPVNAADPAPAAADAPLDVTITGVAKDEVPVVKTPPPLTLPFRDVISLSREGQTDQVLAEQVQHMSRQEQTRLIEVDSRQTSSPLLVQLPQPPFFRLEAPNLQPYFWEFQVVDQSNQVVRKTQGSALPQRFLEWDGYDEGQFRVLVGPAYSPVLIVTDAAGKKRRFFGDPVQLDAVQYEQDGLMHLEFNNDRLYERDGPGFAKEMSALLSASLNVMRKRVGTPFRVIIYERPDAGALTQKRLENWKTFLQERLVLEPDDITLVTMAPKDRGRVTALMMLAEP
jgi:hypothetical protein